MVIFKLNERIPLIRLRLAMAGLDIGVEING